MSESFAELFEESLRGQTMQPGSIIMGRVVGIRGDSVIVNAKWAAENEAFMVELVKQLAKADADYRANAAKWGADSPQVKAGAKWTKAGAANVPAAMALYKFPTLAEQASPAWLGGRVEVQKV